MLFALGRTAPEVMSQLGHTDPKVTLGIYARAMGRGEDEDGRLRALADGSDWAAGGVLKQMTPATTAHDVPGLNS